MIEFFNARMQEAKLNTAPGNPVIAAQINLEQNFAFIEVHVWLCVLMVISLTPKTLHSWNAYIVLYPDIILISLLDDTNLMYLQNVFSSVQLKRLPRQWHLMGSY